MEAPKHQRLAIRIALRGVMLAIPLLFTSCGDERYVAVPTYPATGHVIVEGKPIEGAYVKLTPVDSVGDPDALSPRAKSDEDGMFRLSTYTKGDGAPAGRYAVTIVWREPANPPMRRNPEPDRLGGRYADPQDTNWQVEITEGENVLEPFVLERVQ